ncbi:hypothetical protein LguiA_028348 [Lonicera macranthoides]
MASELINSTNKSSPKLAPLSWHKLDDGLSSTKLSKSSPISPSKERETLRIEPYSLSASKGKVLLIKICLNSSSRRDIANWSALSARSIISPLDWIERSSVS